jgi:5-formyltetrahydrofolate cyclo-ligase
MSLAVTVNSLGVAPPDDTLLNKALTKAAWRVRLMAARQAVPAQTRAAEALALARVVEEGLGGDDTLGGSADTVCAYVPREAEPGSLALLDALRSRGLRVLVPVVVGTAPLDWGEYLGVESLRPGPFGLCEPSGPRLGPGAVRAVDAVLVPALAVDRRGVRIGRGGGHYDRSLALVEPGMPLIAVVRDDELVDELPAERHDVGMSAVLTPRRGLLRLPLS